MFQHRAAVKHAAQLPIAFAQRRDQHAAVQFFRCQGAGPLRRHAAVTADHTMVQAVLDCPHRALALDILACEVGQIIGRQAQGPVHLGATAGLVQQQIDDRAVIIIAQVVGLGVTALDQVFKQGTVLAAFGSVADQCAAGGEQGEAAQVR